MRRSNYVDQLHREFDTGAYSKVIDVNRRCVGRTVDVCPVDRAWAVSMVDVIVAIAKEGSATSDHYTRDIGCLVYFGTQNGLNEEWIGYTKSYNPWARVTHICEPWVRYMRWLRGEYMGCVNPKHPTHTDAHAHVKRTLRYVFDVFRAQHPTWTYYIGGGEEEEEYDALRVSPRNVPVLMLENDSVSWTFTLWQENQE